MSFYHLVHGLNPYAASLLGSLGFNLEGIPRFRDCWWDGTYIVVYTRTGGGNREAYAEGNAAMRQVHGYSHDADDAYDATYAAFYYRPSATMQATLVGAGVPAVTVSPGDRWKAALDRLTADPESAESQRITNALRPVIDAALEGRSGIAVVDGIAGTVDMEPLPKAGHD